MNNELAKVIDSCLAQISRGESVEQCLADYPKEMKELEPLLKTAVAIASIPRVTPSEEFRHNSQLRLMSRLSQESAPGNGKRHYTSPGNNPVRNWHIIWRILATKTVIATSIAVVLILAVGLSFLVPRGTGVLANYTLSVLSGKVEIQALGSFEWQPGTDGLNLNERFRIRTAPGSYAVITSIDGSTTKLEPETDLAVLASENNDSFVTRIVLDQRLGKVWNYVLTSGHNTTQFELGTPSAKIGALGTSFISEVDSRGLTTVVAVEGTVNVRAQEKEVFLTMNQQTQVQPGTAPKSPESLPEVRSELVVSTSPSAVSAVRDPSGSSTGYLPNGVSFNQITKSKNILYSDGQQVVVDEPLPGEYAIIVRSLSRDVIPIDIQVRSGGKVVSVFKDTLSGTEGDWLIRIKLGDSISKSGYRLFAVEPLGNRKVENIVETQIALNRATPFTVNFTSRQTPSLMPASLTPQNNSQAAKEESQISTPEVTTRAKLSPTPLETSVTPSSTPSVRPVVTPDPVTTPVPSTSVKPADISTGSNTGGTTTTVTPTPTKTPSPTTSSTASNSTGDSTTEEKTVIPNVSTTSK